MRDATTRDKEKSPYAHGQSANEKRDMSHRGKTSVDRESRSFPFLSILSRLSLQSLRLDYLP